jgi:transcriptional regulator NrdR family protein
MTRSTRPLHLLGSRANGPACPDPDCGSTKSHRMQSGWSPDDQFIRYRSCYGCHKSFATVEIIVPPETTFYSLDEDGRLMRRERYRRKYAKGGRLAPWNQRTSDRLEIDVRVIKGGRGERHDRGRRAG